MRDFDEDEDECLPPDTPRLIVEVNGGVVCNCSLAVLALQEQLTGGRPMTLHLTGPSTVTIQVVE